MHYIYLVSSVFLSASASIFGGFYGRMTKGKRDASALYTFLVCAAAFVGWVVLFLTDPSFDVMVIPFSVGFGICYAMCQFGLTSALRTGPVALTTLMVNLSLIATVIWVFIFWDAKFSLLAVIGIILVVISFWLCLSTKKGSDKADEKKISLKWFVYAAIAFIGNAGCTIVQRSQQTYSGGQHGKIMMVFAIFFSVVFTFVVYLKSDKSDSKAIIRSRSLAMPILSGVFNVFLNLFVILLATSPISPSVIYPVIAVGALSVSSIFTLAVFKEKLYRWQWIGIAVGAAAVALLSI
jgi:drug/metabolite transporter (DMT)-like permease